MKPAEIIFKDHFEIKSDINDFDYFDDIRYCSSRIKPNCNGIYISEIYELIKKAQSEAIDETVKACAEAAKTKWYQDENDKLNVMVSKQSILSVAEQLKSKL